MERETEQDFTFGNDDDEEFSNDLSANRLAKLNQKVTLLSVLLPFIVVLLVVFIYFDISSKVVKVDSSGDAKVQSISQELEKTVAELKSKSGDLEKRLSQKIGAMEKSIDEINNKLKKAEKNISYMTWSKSDKKPTDKEIEAIKASTGDIQTKLASLSEKGKEIDIIAESLRSRTKTLEELTVSVKNLKAELNKNTGDYVSRKDLDDSLKKQKRIFSLELDQFSEKFNKKLALIKFATQTNTTKPESTEKKTVQ